MAEPPLIRRALRAFLAAVAAGAFIGGLLTATASPSHAATQGPCDIYAAGGTPCVAAHSTTRALYGTYSGPLYQVIRASDSATKDIGLLSAGGYADAAAQDSFCANTSCLISVIYDQSGKGNKLARAPKGQFPGPGPGGSDNLANAFEAPITVAGHKAYGVYVAPGTGYRNNNTNGIATGDQPEGMYAIFDGTHYNAGCCFDYGNAETSGNNDGNGTMEAIYFGDSKYWGYGTGSGPWVMADLENGLFSGVNRGYNPNTPSVNHRFVTAMLKGGPNQWATRGGNAQSGGLSTYYSGPRPNVAGYNPMKKQGAIILGIGGDNSNSSAGTFYEGVMTAGYPSDATESAVQANITAAGYSNATTGTGALTPGARVSLKATTAPCCTSHYLRRNAADSTVGISVVNSSSPSADKADATWIVRAGLANTSCLSFESAGRPGQFLRHYNFRLSVNTDNGGGAFTQDATFCPTAGNSGTGTSFKSVNYPTKYVRHYNYAAYIASNGGSNAWDSTTAWAQDTSWLTAAPLS
ncbi:putative alpha-N-arabinofuranosidase B [Streptomyces davaonensis JCM 4913]|uniref:Putative alpha-N-arabinofuranosidase B n=1 Tax=Streptomyces davaonensis (strain DSM 101723 / JCM 4913 / KCC S-0913 / 768) TaxID=1214101 RepID=K4QY67_STRDJ|nr:alpha-L-arabinofuranosidase B [Streptomyces davaonensis]CCK26018.1 putative alpha-N-arabinofuranosidase B [Streptomyces davaonensis JCM 4913]